MNVLLKVLPLLGYLVSQMAYAEGANLFGLPAHEETTDKIIKRSVVHIPEWKKWLVSEEHGIKNSGDIWYELSLREKDGTISARFPALVGPYHLSPANRQIFACESNVMNDAKEAFILDMNGRVVSKIKHEGFFGDCGTTVDKRLYWLVYRDAVNEKPVTDVVIVTMQGKAIKRMRLHKRESVQVEYEGQKYILPFPAPKLPG